MLLRLRRAEALATVALNTSDGGSEMAAHVTVVRSETTTQADQEKTEESTATQRPPSPNVTDAMLVKLIAMMGL
jgi:hypothetical protein